MWFYGVMVSTLDSESSDPNSNLGRTLYKLFLFYFRVFLDMHSKSCYKIMIFKLCIILSFDILMSHDPFKFANGAVILGYIMQTTNKLKLTNGSGYIFQKHLHDDMVLSKINKHYNNPMKHIATNISELLKRIIVRIGFFFSFVIIKT